MKITGSRNTLIGRTFGTRMLFTPPSFTLIFRHKFDSVCGVVLFTFFACTHWVARPINVSPTRFTSAYTGVLPGKTTTMSCRPLYDVFRNLNIGSTCSMPVAYLQKHGWPTMGMPASFEMRCNC